MLRIKYKLRQRKLRPTLTEREQQTGRRALIFCVAATSKIIEKEAATMLKHFLSDSKDNFDLM